MFFVSNFATKPLYMKTLLFFLAALFSLSVINAEEIKLPLKETPEENPPKDNFNRHRLPGRPIMCSIDSETGVSIPGVDSSEIISFEIYDESGELCFATFNNEQDFVSFLFSLEGNYVIRFVTDEKQYKGYVSL